MRDAGGEGCRREKVVPAVPVDVITCFLQIPKHVGLIRLKGIRGTAMTPHMSGPTSDEATTRWLTHWVLHITLLKASSLRSQAVDVRSLHERMAIARDALRAQLIGHIEDKVRATARFRQTAHSRAWSATGALPARPSQESRVWSGNLFSSASFLEGVYSNKMRYQGREFEDRDRSCERGSDGFLLQRNEKSMAAGRPHF
jgi:hypothetical protein